MGLTKDEIECASITIKAMHLLKDYRIGFVGHVCGLDGLRVSLVKKGESFGIFMFLDDEPIRAAIRKGPAKLYDEIRGQINQFLEGLALASNDYEYA